MNPVKIPSQKKKPKYHNVKTVVDGIAFDSKREATRYQYLKLLERKGEICCLKLQVPFELFPSQRIAGRVVERSWSYVADFTYETGGKLVVEDSKGVRTADYIGKRKAMLFLHGIQIKEV
jgi:hypothetical protein